MRYGKAPRFPHSGSLGNLRSDRLSRWNTTFRLPIQLVMAEEPTKFSQSFLRLTDLTGVTTMR